MRDMTVWHAGMILQLTALRVLIDHMWYPDSEVHTRDIVALELKAKQIVASLMLDLWS